MANAIALTIGTGTFGIVALVGSVTPVTVACGVIVGFGILASYVCRQIEKRIWDK